MNAHALVALIDGLVPGQYHLQSVGSETTGRVTAILLVIGVADGEAAMQVATALSRVVNPPLIER